MKLKYLGTAAAEGYPAIFCSCENCRKASRLKGKNIRSRSQAIIDDSLMIDFPSDTYYHCLLNNIDLNKVHNILITHIHDDHFYPIELLYLNDNYSHPGNEYKLNLYGSIDVENVLSNLPQMTEKYFNYVRINPFEPFKIDKYTVTALKAYHGTDNPYIYTVSDGERTILYAHDTDIFPAETWDYMINNNICLDLVSLDCTEGAYEDLKYHGHMCLGRSIVCRDRMLKEKIISERTKMVLNHFSHNGISSVYDEFKPIANNNGFEISYDGMEITI